MTQVLLLDIILLNAGDPTLGFISSARNLLFVSKEWNNSLLVCDNFADRLIKESWWILPLSDRCKAFHFKIEHIQPIRKRLQIVTEKIYLDVTKGQGGLVFSPKIYHVTHGWSYFDNGRAQFYSPNDTALHLARRHGFSELPVSDIPPYRAFERQRSAVKEKMLLFVLDSILKNT